jgi:hypothetical protein
MKSKKTKNIKKKINNTTYKKKKNQPLPDINYELGSSILKTSIQNLKDENFHFYNSLVLPDDLTFQ